MPCAAWFALKWTKFGSGHHQQAAGEEVRQRTGREGKGSEGIIMTNLDTNLSKEWRNFGSSVMRRLASSPFEDPLIRSVHSHSHSPCAWPPLCFLCACDVAKQVDKEIITFMVKNTVLRLREIAPPCRAPGQRKRGRGVTQPWTLLFLLSLLYRILEAPFNHIGLCPSCFCPADLVLHLSHSLSNGTRVLAPSVRPIHFTGKFYAAWQLNVTPLAI